MRLVVVGGGPAGFMAAIQAARAAEGMDSRNLLEVVVLEATSKVNGKSLATQTTACSLPGPLAKDAGVLRELSWTSDSNACVERFLEKSRSVEVGVAMSCTTRQRASG